MRPSPPLTHAPRRLVNIAVLLAGLALTSAAPAQQLEVVASGFERPLSITHAGDGSDRLFVLEQRGTVRVLSAERHLEDDFFLDLRDRTRAQGERGMLGLAFHPDFAANGRLFVHYTDHIGTSTLSELRSADRASVDAATERVVLTQSQPFANHNGGQIAFGPDGYLYLALGDGGSGGDPARVGQDLGTWLGTLLRIDVDRAAPYEVPADNPFVATEGARPEIWAYGLRNPWRFSFDDDTGDLWIADVGQSAVEEVNVQPADSSGGENYGWRVMEGDRCFDPRQGCPTDGLVLPVIAYTHASGWGRSITGGYLYRGDDVPALHGAYVFGDFVSGRIFVAEGSGTQWQARPLLDAGFGISTFGQDEGRELYIADYGGGRVLRFVD
ncbi:MAG: PQQ-dependent sugar dehydrogenase [Trueperaceae bacterium]|nr:PQQ-dependent sugar dehydrogenase [Trueperaceae bacterium]